MGFAAVAVEALLEQADFGLEVGEALLAFDVALRQAGLQVALALGALFLAFGLAEASALGEGLGEADWLACVTEEWLAGGQATGCPAGQRVAGGGGVGFHAGSMPGQPAQG